MTAANGFRGHCTVLALASSLIIPSLARAQAPWTVTLTPTLDPLPIGVCAAVHLTLIDPATKDVPRNPLGYRVTIADFDMTVTTPTANAVVGQQIDASHWSVCACQDATLRTVATISASYPARTLAAKSRAPGVAFQTEATFTVSAVKGTANPPGCNSSRGTIARADPAPTPLPSSPAPAKTAAPTRDGGKPPLGDAPPGAPPVRPTLAGAPPTDVAVTGTPLVARLTWTAAPNATRYAVWRGYTGTVSVERSPPGFTNTQYTDTIPDPRIVFRYTVVAHYADGTSGAATAADFTSPPLANPTGFTATNIGDGKVQLEWQPVAGAARYRIDGPGIPNGGWLYQTSTSRTAQLLPMGPLAWKVTAVYPGNYADYATATVATAMVRALPPHAPAFLSKKNGAGSIEQATAHMALICAGGAYCFDSLTSKVRATSGRSLDWWGDPERPLGSSVRMVEAVYGNANDLGVGRRTSCFRISATKDMVGATTVCYSTSHGAAPGQAGFGDPQVMTQAAKGVTTSPAPPLSSKNDPWGGMPRGASVIIKDDRGWIFLAMTAGKWDLNERGQTTGLWWPSWLEQPQLLPAVTMDGDGPKHVPHACLACHGGLYDPVSKRVIGASLLPLDPGSLVFDTTKLVGNADRRMYQQSGMQQINQVVVSSATTSAIASYLRELYDGKIDQPGSLARDDFVPSGWSQQPGLYRQVVKPYCASCHLAAASNINFASWSNFVANKATIRASVCAQHSMPHSEIAFRGFWTKDTGPIYLPGLLAAALGFPGC